jgi:predicted MPP superfamily phosphohydrolase
LNKKYFNPRRKQKDSAVENEKRKLNNEAVKKFVSGGVHEKQHRKKARD